MGAFAPIYIYIKKEDYMVKIQFTTPEGKVLKREYTEGDIRIKKWLDEGWKEVNKPKAKTLAKSKGGK